MAHGLLGRGITWRDLNPAEGAHQMHELHSYGAGHTADVLEGLIRDTDRAGVVAAPEVQNLFNACSHAQGYLVTFAARRRQHLPLVVTAFARDEEGILAAAHQIEANLLHSLAK